MRNSRFGHPKVHFIAGYLDRRDMLDFVLSDWKGSEAAERASEVATLAAKCVLKLKRNS